MDGSLSSRAGCLQDDDGAHSKSCPRSAITSWGAGYGTHMEDTWSLAWFEFAYGHF